MEYFSQFIISQASVRCDPQNVGPKICNPLFNLTYNGVPVSDVETFIKVILNDLGGVIGLIAITMLVFAGFRMITANGDKIVIDRSKQILKYSIYGFIAAVFAYAGVVAIEEFIQVRDVETNTTNIINPLSQQNFIEFVEQMIRNTMVILGIVSTFMIILNGFRYMTARGDQATVEKAKLGLTWAIGGLALSLLAYTIISALANLIS
jgi:hypothetical protein